jgi:peptidyl-prolyl cis-trans isomerase B (cyclophilin B)
VASTKDRQRALERARYERVQAKIAQQRKAQARRKRVSIFTAIAVVLVGGGVASALVLTSSSTPAKPIAASTNTAAAASPSSSAEAVGYKAAGTASKNVGVPTYDATAAAAPYTATIHTNRGDVVFTALTTKAPYTTFSFQFLAGKSYFNNTPCHRLVTSGNGSQFFLVYKDSPLSPNYTPFGTITKGLDVLQAIAAGGADNSNATGDGKPKLTTTIESVTVTKG